MTIENKTSKNLEEYENSVLTCDCSSAANQRGKPALGATSDVEGGGEGSGAFGYMLDGPIDPISLFDGLGGGNWASWAKLGHRPMTSYYYYY